MELYPKDNDPSAEFDVDELEIIYYLPHIYSIEELNNTIEHEWLHALCLWADEDNWSEKGDHYIQRILGYGE